MTRQKYSALNRRLRFVGAGRNDVHEGMGGVNRSTDLHPAVRMPRPVEYIMSGVLGIAALH